VSAMKAVVVYESHWGNTAAIARAIAEGIGPEARAISTAQASGAAISDADLIVAGAPVLGFRIPSDNMLKMMGASSGKDPVAPDLSHPSMRSWLDALPKGSGRSAAFETRIWWSPGGATAAIVRGLESAGYRPVAKARRFIVKGKYGPLRDGELERARLWGAELAQAMG
jgi:Flavodoxin domain